MAWTGIPKSALQFEYKPGTIPFIYRSTVGDTGVCIGERHCCSSCGCNILLQYYLYPEKSHVAAPTIVKNDFAMPKVGCHIWTRHTPCWHKIPDDGVKRDYEFGDDFQAKVDEYVSEHRKS